MERSEPDDGAWEDPLGMNMPGEPEYPPAPIPFHERRWRHPSEIGHQAWVQSERSVGVGRGLLVTSGAIGCILGLAVVWLMVPGPGGAPTAAPTVSRSDLVLPTTVAFAIASPTTLPLAGALASVAPSIEVTLPSVPVTVGTPVSSTIAGPESVAVTTPTLQLPSEDLPTNTVWLKSEAEGAEAAVAVLVGDSPYMITTATAVGSVETVRVMLASGGVTETDVVSVDETFAYLMPDDSLASFGFAEAAVAVPGESLTVLTEEQIVFSLGDDTLAAVDPATVAEGTPVVNEDGALVGLCTGAGGTLDLVPIDPAMIPASEPDPVGGSPTTDSVDVTPSNSSTPSSAPTPTTTTSTTPATTTTSSSSTTSTTSTSSTTTSTTVLATTTVPPAKKSPWMGVRLAGRDAPAQLVINAITVGSPAEAAGLVVGEKIVAIDSVAVATIDELVAKVGPRAPGDTIVVTVSAVAADGTTTERHVSVVLGENSL